MSLLDKLEKVPADHIKDYLVQTLYNNYDGWTRKEIRVIKDILRDIQIHDESLQVTKEENKVEPNKDGIRIDFKNDHASEAVCETLAWILLDTKVKEHFMLEQLHVIGKYDDEYDVHSYLWDKIQM